MNTAIDMMNDTFSPTRRAHEIIRASDAFDDTPRYRAHWKFNTEGMRVREDIVAAPVQLCTLSLDDFTADYARFQLSCAGYPSADQPEGTDEYGYRNIAYALAIVPRDSTREVVIAKQGSYRTMCGGQQISYSTLDPRTNKDFYQTGRYSFVDAVREKRDTRVSHSLASGMGENSIGILAVNIDTQFHNDHFDSVWQEMLDDNEDDGNLSYVRSEYPSPSHEGVTAINYVIHYLDAGCHDENSEDDGYYDECPSCDNCGYEMHWSDEADSWMCDECGCDEPARERASEDAHIDDGAEGSLRENWVAGVPEWRAFTVCFSQLSSLTSNSPRLLNYYGGLLRDRDTVTAACWKVKIVDRLSLIQEQCSVPFPPLDITEALPTERRQIEEIMSALGCLHTEDDAEGDNWGEKVEGFYTGTTHLKYPVYISCNVGTGCQGTLNVMKVLIQNDDYLRERFGCTVAQPDEIATNPKEGYHYIDSLVLLPLQGGKA